MLEKIERGSDFLTSALSATRKPSGVHGGISLVK